MPALKINENQFKHICDDAKVPCRYSFVPGSSKQTPYVLIEWDNRANHVHAELLKLHNGKYFRLTGSNPNKLVYEFEMTGFHLKLKDSEKVYDYMGFVLNNGGVWDPAWSKQQKETVTPRGMPKFINRKLGDDSEADLMRIGRSFIKDLGTVTGTEQALGNAFEGY